MHINWDLRKKIFLGPHYINLEVVRDTNLAYKTMEIYKIKDGNYEIEYTFIFEVIEKDGDKRTVFQRYLSEKAAKECANSWNETCKGNKIFYVMKQPLYIR